MPQDVVAASARGATFLILLQMGSRALTFALNQILLRFLSPQLLGVSVQLELYVIATLYFSRESLRIAAQRRSDGGVQAAVNLSYLAIIAGLPLGLLFAQLMLRNRPANIPYFEEALRIDELAVMIELISEPAFVVVGQHMLYKVRASAEATAVVMKTIATASLVFWSKQNGQELGVLPFAAGELAYSTSLAIVYTTQTAPTTRGQKLSLLPTEMKSSTNNEFFLSYFSKPLLSLSTSLYLQAGVKYILTQGDSLLIAGLASLKAQGMYALSANYGGLIARMIFRPIEDSSRNLFAKLCAESDEKPPVDSKKNAGQDQKNDDTKAAAARKQNFQQAASLLRDILQIYALGSVVAFVAGPTAAPLLLNLVAGPTWGEAGPVLGTYCYYIPLLAINGVSEAFVAATASTRELQSQSLWMGAFFVTFASSAYYFVKVLDMGAKGLVLANCASMAMRIVFNLRYVSGFFEQRGVTFSARDFLPSGMTILCAAVAQGLLQQTINLASEYGPLGKLAGIAAVTAALGLATLFFERAFVIDAYKRYTKS